MEPSRTTLRAIIANVVFKNLFDARTTAPAVLPDYPLSPHLRHGSSPATFTARPAAARAGSSSGKDMLETLLSDTLTAATAEAAGFRPQQRSAGPVPATRDASRGSGTSEARKPAAAGSANDAAAQVSARPNAALRRKDISRCRVLRGTIHKFEEDFLAAHGHRPHGSEREPLADAYAEYRSLKQAVRGK
jgi:hypothetical protein